jgi:hypothetical protein
MAEMRYRKLVLSHETFLGLLRTGAHPGYTVANGLPEDAIFVSGRVSQDRVELILQSASFEPIKSGRIPDLSPVVTTVTAMDIAEAAEIASTLRTDQ